LFSVGQTVRLKARIGVSSKTAELYHITAVLPASGNYPQYRVRNDDERHERMTSEDDLESVGPSPFRQDVAHDRRTGGPETEARQMGASGPWTPTAAKYVFKR
jgi:hypothetical protein